ncbi:hypothetical protein [Clostridium rectalis]|uniref:hypothetical protein n=1 Tax=Clostridium rectalis TaxID=2040295 RepID=UPI000F62C8B6|nr:hypothetical protein [Clostridium rectalis]
MNYSERLIGLINKKWVRNDMGLGKVQFLKLISVKEKLFILIISNNIKKPIYSKVEDIIISNNQIVVFYDGEYCEDLKYEEYEKFHNVFSKKEWDTVFKEDVTYKLEEIGVLEKRMDFLHNYMEILKSLIKQVLIKKLRSI